MDVLEAEKGRGSFSSHFHGLYSNAHRGKMRKREVAPSRPLIIEDKQYVPSRGWAEIIKKVHVSTLFRHFR